MTLSTSKLVIFSGGTGCNELAGELKSTTSFVSYILPVSDDGGSSAEIRRMFGGPSIGDFRSRIMRLADDSTAEGRRVKQLLKARLDPSSRRKARLQWDAMVEGHGFCKDCKAVLPLCEEYEEPAPSCNGKGGECESLWNYIRPAYKETIRIFLVYLQTEILRRSSSEQFDFRNASLGNLFLAGAMIFFDYSISTAGFWFCRVCGVPEETHCFPILSLRHKAVSIAAEVMDHDGRQNVIVGQSAISHPPSLSDSVANVVDKNSGGSLNGRIQKVFYVDEDGTPLRTGRLLCAGALEQLSQASLIVFSMGSLFTSIIPSLVVEGVGSIIADSCARKVLLLNGYEDRETKGMTAIDHLLAIKKALEQSCGQQRTIDVRQAVTDLVVCKSGQIRVENAAITKMGIQLHVADDKEVGKYHVSSVVNILSSIAL